MPDDKPGTVEAFVEWLYSGSRECLRNHYIMAKNESSLIIELFFFADKYMVTDLKVRIISKLYISIRDNRDREMKQWVIESIPRIWEQTTADAGIRRLPVDFMAWKVNLESYQNPKSMPMLLRLPVEVHAALVVTFASRISKPNQPNAFLFRSVEDNYDDVSGKESTEQSQ